MMKTLTESEAVALCEPMPYALVTSLDRNGRANALGVAWVTRASFSPFLMMVSIDRRRYSHDGIDLHREFVINYPNDDQSKGAWICGTRSGRDGDKMKLSGLELTDSKAVRVPTIKDATVSFECRVVNQFEAGDHTVFVGEVVAMQGNPEKPGHLFVASGYRLISLDQNGDRKS
ncbi:MAG TPA: flavin reductase family protein [Methanotrichaceae archaeon]|nr:flavin reductase family protein [Methanotrichaceae archaeon]